MEVTTALGPATVLSVTGDIDAATSPELVKEAVKALDAEHVNLVLDLSGVDYISSGGLVALQIITSRASSRDGRMVLCGVGERASQVLGMTGFDQKLDTYPDVAAAKASFSAE